MPQITENSLAKEKIRESIWELLVNRGVARFPGAFGRIPNFVGAEAAALRASSLPEFKKARFIAVNPDSPQFPLRVKALEAGKVIFMAAPKLKSPKPFFRLDPRQLRVHPLRAAPIKGALRYGVAIDLEDIPPIDLFVTGCVAVTITGKRLGKGGGFADREYALLVNKKLIKPSTPVLTTVHPLQIVKDLPQDEHDLHVDIIVTPKDICYTQPKDGVKNLNCFT